jgi:crotonobetainyl-CoA:carnitine CoA-transferase CaiB-like acyl-CoA transferase
VFCRAIERPDLAQNPAYENNAARIRNRAVLEPLLDDTFHARPAAEWIERLQGAGIPASVVRNFEDVVEHPQSAARQMFPTLDHPTAGSHRVTGTPIKLSETPGKLGRAAPMLGQHSASALRDLLGLDDAALGALVGRGVI